MLDVLLDAFLDTLKTLPFLFGAYLLIEFLEHKASDKLTGALSRMGPLGPLGGAALGLVPQCGFSVAAANFYAGRLISAGTLVAVFLATSDEALPIMLSRPEAFPVLLRLLAVKFVAAAVFGMLTDLVLKRFLKPDRQEPFHDLCEDCDCEHEGIFKSALRHTVKIAVFLLLINLILGYAIYFIGEANISRFLLSGSIFQPLLAADSKLRRLCYSDGAVPLRLPLLRLCGSRALHGGRPGSGCALPRQQAPPGEPLHSGSAVCVRRNYRCGLQPVFPRLMTAGALFRRRKLENFGVN